MLGTYPLSTLPLSTLEAVVTPVIGHVRRPPIRRYEQPIQQSIEYYDEVISPAVVWLRTKRIVSAVEYADNWQGVVYGLRSNGLDAYIERNESIDGVTVHSRSLLWSVNIEGLFDAVTVRAVTGDTLSAIETFDNLAAVFASIRTNGFDSTIDAWAAFEQQAVSLATKEIEAYVVRLVSSKPVVFVQSAVTVKDYEKAMKLAAKVGLLEMMEAKNV